MLNRPVFDLQTRQQICFGAITLSRLSQDSSAQSDYHDMIAPMRHPIAIFVNEEQHDWHAYAHTILTDNALHRRDLTAALQANRAARAYGLQRPNTIDYLQSQLKYSLLHFYEGSYDLSEALLTKLREEIRGYDIPIFVARIDMRLAAIAALQHQPETAERLIAASPLITLTSFVEGFLRKSISRSA